LLLHGCCKVTSNCE
jgi:hypothetical protein